mmetsp:Transcript_17502/g.45760  ORF Transcript_17502/g.45760 Transcript_17502/m.45760 type:complete len:222 (+) Transcript_17502:323-988(+)
MPQFSVIVHLSLRARLSRSATIVLSATAAQQSLSVARSAMASAALPMTAADCALSAGSSIMMPPHSFTTVRASTFSRMHLVMIRTTASKICSSNSSLIRLALIICSKVPVLTNKPTNGAVVHRRDSNSAALATTADEPLCSSGARRSKVDLLCRSSRGLGSRHKLHSIPSVLGSASAFLDTRQSSSFVSGTLASLARRAGSDESAIISDTARVEASPPLPS